MIWGWLGVLLLISGSASLIMNEVAVSLRRALKPWWRNDRDPIKDEFMREALRHVAYLTSIISIELGLALADIRTVPMTVRLFIYLAFGGELVFRRREFWAKVLDRSAHQAYWFAVNAEVREPHRPRDPER